LVGKVANSALGLLRPAAPHPQSDKQHLELIQSDSTTVRKPQSLCSSPLVISLVHNAVDEVRRLERKDHPELVGSRYVWLKNPENLTEGQWKTFDTLDSLNSHLKTARA
jgi:hypothetical protein